jgi:bifunctional non-homologous end joining protein LigD
MPDGLDRYRALRDQRRTPEPVPAAANDLPVGRDDTFVIQEHHARALHWDLRLERGGVLVSWAVPKGIPLTPKLNHLAVHTEDHPLEYANFAGVIPAGEYGGGQMSIWDHGTYETEKWSDDEVKVVLHGNRVSGRYVLFHTRGKDWMIRRMDPASNPDWRPLPNLIRPMLAVPGVLPPAADDDRWGYETKWDGLRAVAHVEGGRIRLMSRNDRDVTVSFPELAALGEQLGSTQAILDGEIVAIGDDGLPSFGRLQKRMHIGSREQARRLAGSDAVTYLIFDLLHLDGASMLERSYLDRRKVLEELALAGEAWQTPRYFRGGGADVLRASQEHGLEGIVAKRLDGTYKPGARSSAWIKIKNIRTQEVIIGGWTPGNGRRSGTIGALLLGIPDRDGLRYIGKVGTGFTEAMLDDLLGRLQRLERRESQFISPIPSADARTARWVTPQVVGEVAFAEWTQDGRLRHPSWRGLRTDKLPTDVVRES